MATIRKTPKIQKNSKKCSIPTCRKSYRSNAGIQLFKFPDPSTILGQIWRLKCGFPLDSKKRIICQHHFMPGCYGKRYLKKNSIPTINLASPKEGCSKQNARVETLVYQMEHQDDNNDAMMIPPPEITHIKLENLELSSDNFQGDDVVEDWAQYNDNNDSFQSSENDKEPKSKRMRFDSTEPDTIEKESDDNIFGLLSASDSEKMRPRTCKTINNDKKSEKTDNEVLQETLHCMKALLSTGQERDEYTVFVEHIGNKLRTCNRDSIEIKIAQHHIENIVFNLAMGLYSQNGNYSEATNGSPNFRDFETEIVTPDLPTCPTAVENITPKEEPNV